MGASNPAISFLVIPKSRKATRPPNSVWVARTPVSSTYTRTPAPVGTALAVAPGQAAVGHASEPHDVVVFSLDGDGPRVVHEREMIDETMWLSELTRMQDAEGGQRTRLRFIPLGALVLGEPGQRSKGRKKGA